MVWSQVEALAHGFGLIRPSQPMASLGLGLCVCTEPQLLLHEWLSISPPKKPEIQVQKHQPKSFQVPIQPARKVLPAHTCRGQSQALPTPKKAPLASERN